MGSSAAGAAGVKFDRPPVQAVYLTLYFRTDGHVQSSHLASLHERWATDFPLVSEAPPLRGDEDPDSGPVFLASSAGWPIPYTRYEAVDSDNSVSYQHDRLEVAWNFKLEYERTYPGFESLFRTFSEKFAEFCAALERAGINVKVTRAECQYTNAMIDLSDADVAVGVLTDWRASTRDLVPRPGFVSMRVHACAGSHNDDCDSHIIVDGNTGDDEPTKLVFIVSRSLGETDQSPSDGLRAAHDELIELFLRHTPNHLQDKWGRRDDA